MPIGTFEVIALPFKFGPEVFGISSLLGGPRPFTIHVQAGSISDAPGPVQGQPSYWDDQDRFRTDSFFDSIRATAGSRNAFTPKVRFKSLTVNGQVVRGRWSVDAA